MLLKMQTRNKNANFTQSKQFYGTSSHCHDNYCISEFFFFSIANFQLKGDRLSFFNFFLTTKTWGQ